MKKNRHNFPNIDDTDRVFEYEGTLVKVRIIRKNVHHDGLSTNAHSIALNITGSVCDKDGKAISRAEGYHYICSKSHTITLENILDVDFKDQINTYVAECVELTVKQNLKIEEMDSLVNRWKSPAKFFS